MSISHKGWLLRDYGLRDGLENKQDEDPCATDKQINLTQKGFNKPNNEDISGGGLYENTGSTVSLETQSKFT